MKLEVSCQHKYQGNYVRHITRVLKKLPKDVKEDICKNCVVFMPGKEHGYYYYKTNKKIIILNWFAMQFDKISLKQIRYTIAHEFAHYILKHKNLTEEEEKILSVEHEKEADDLATQWGFPPDKKYKLRHCRTFQ